jgi:Dolichyl-phosphate-mannose-protein mannosyltransferase
MDQRPNDSRPARSSRAARAGLALLLVLGLVLRLVGLDHGLPQQTEPDGLVFATQTALIRSGAAHPETEREWGYYPQLVPRIAALLPGTGGTPPAQRDGQLAAASRDWHDARLVVALLSLLAIPGTYFLARRFLSSGWSLAAAALADTSTLTLWFAQQARPHAAAAALVLLALVAALRVLERGAWSDVLLAGLAAALALGTLQFGVFALPPILLAILLAEGRGWGWRAGAVLAVLGLPALAALVFYPLLFFSGHVIYTGLFNGGGFAAIAGALAGYDPWLAAAALGGGGVLLAALARGARPSRERARALLVVLAYALPFLLAIGLYQRTYQRFAIPLVPFLALAAAAGCARIVLRGALARAALSCALLAPQLALAARLALLRSRPDTVAEAAQWIEARVPPGPERVLFLPTHDLPLPLDAQALESNAAMMDSPARPWYRYQRALAPEQRLAPGWKLLAMPLKPAAQELLSADAPRYLRTLAADWLVVEVYTEGRKPLVLDALHPALAEVAERAARIAPEDGGAQDDLPLTWSDDEYPRWECWALRLFRAQRLGPVIEIWRAKR